MTALPMTLALANMVSGPCGQVLGCADREVSSIHNRPALNSSFNPISRISSIGINLTSACRSLENFKINQPQDRMPPGVVKAFGIIKGAAAKVNVKYGLGTDRLP